MCPVEGNGPVKWSDKAGFPEPGGDIVRVSMEIQTFPLKKKQHNNLAIFAGNHITKMIFLQIRNGRSLHTANRMSSSCHHISFASCCQHLTGRDFLKILQPPGMQHSFFLSFFLSFFILKMHRKQAVFSPLQSHTAAVIINYNELQHVAAPTS